MQELAWSDSPGRSKTYGVKYTVSLMVKGVSQCVNQLGRHICRPGQQFAQ